MAMSGFLKNISGRSGASAGVSADLRSRVLDQFEEAGIGWVWATDSDGKLCYLSERAAASLGQEVGALLGHPIEDVFEVDEENPDQQGVRPLKFQIKGHKKIREQVVRFEASTSLDH